jgi:SAM-dependent methyltransferase
LIDIGCGAGLTTKEIAPQVSEAFGVDFSEGMIERASTPPVPSNAKFAVADVLNLSQKDFGTFDVALSVRCLINLPDWQTQQIALRNIAQIIRPGGLYLFIEGSSGGRAELNRMREAVGLQSMPTVWHNCDFDRAQTLSYLDEYFSLECELGYGSYDLIARVVHPLLVAPEAPRYEAKINEIAARVAFERMGDTLNSRVAVYLLRRR